MAKIGELEQVENNGEKEFWGQFRTLTTFMKIRLTPNKDFKSGPTSPDFLVMAEGGDSHYMQVGAAWLRTPNNSDSEVKEFLSIQIDDPSMAAPLNVAAFPKDKKKWDITFRRRQSNQASAA